MPAAGVRFEGGRCGRVAGRGGKGGGTFAELAPPRSALQARPRAGQPGARQRPEGHFLTRAVAVEDAGGHLRDQRLCAGKPTRLIHDEHNYGGGQSLGSRPRFLTAF